MRISTETEELALENSLDLRTLLGEFEVLADQVRRDYRELSQEAAGNNSRTLLEKLTKLRQLAERLKPGIIEELPDLSYFGLDSSANLQRRVFYLVKENEFVNASLGEVEGKIDLKRWGGKTDLKNVLPNLGERTPSTSFDICKNAKFLAGNLGSFFYNNTPPTIYHQPTP